MAGLHFSIEENVMKKYIFLLTSLLALSFNVNAALFQGTSTGTFENPTGLPGLVTTGVGTSSFTTGTGPSSLDYTGSAFDVNENISFIFGNLDYHNGGNIAGTTATGVELSVSLNFTAPTVMTESFNFDLGLVNTPNTGTPAENADIISFDNSAAFNFFSYGGTDYTLEFLGFGLLTGSGFTLQNNFHVLEDADANVQLVGRITSTPSAVPVPAALFMFAPALLGFFGLRRKTSQSA